MKKLIICEGKHDCIFFEKLFPKMNIPVSEVRFFIVQESTIKNIASVSEAYSSIRRYAIN